MENFAFHIVNTVLAVVCTSMGILFLVLPLPQNTGLRNFRISLRFLSGAYILLAIHKTFVLINDIGFINIISIENLTISALQALLITFSLITLINPKFINSRMFFLHLIPILLFIIIYSIVSSMFGNPLIENLKELKATIIHPAIIVREVLLLYNVVLLVYLTYIFTNQVNEYKSKLDNYYSESLKLYLPWVKYSFYAALTVGICVLISNFIYSEILEYVLTSCYTIFYIVFGLFYIQYPRTYIDLEPVFEKPENNNEIRKSNKKYIWSEMKEQILTDKYYIKNGVNIEEMARHLRTGRTTLSTHINNNENMNFNSWINSLRVEEAKRLLIENPDYSLTQIAEIVGYSESSNFSRQFKLFTNKTPNVWRKENIIL